VESREGRIKGMPPVSIEEKEKEWNHFEEKVRKKVKEFKEW
jgi:hypothetical protein